MSILRTIICNVCGREHRETEPAAGFPGWAGIHGVSLDGVADPNLCQGCLTEVMEFVEKRKASIPVIYGVD